MRIKNNIMVIKDKGLVFVTVTGFTYTCAVGIAKKLAKNAGISCYEVAVLAGKPSILSHRFRVIPWSEAKEYNIA